MYDVIKGMIGKKVFLILKSGRKYSGIVKEVTESFVFLKDIYDNKVVASIDDISSIQEEK
jgi:hypothetical protein